MSSSLSALGYHTTSTHSPYLTLIHRPNKAHSTRNPKPADYILLLSNIQTDNYYWRMIKAWLQLDTSATQRTGTYLAEAWYAWSNRISTGQCENYVLPYQKHTDHDDEHDQDRSMDWSRSDIMHYITKQGTRITHKNIEGSLELPSANARTKYEHSKIDAGTKLCLALQDDDTTAFLAIRVANQELDRRYLRIIYNQIHRLLGFLELLC